MDYAFDVKPIERDKRELKVGDLFSIWFGAGISIAEFWAGALLTPYLGLSQVVMIIVLGHAIGNLILSFISLAGYYTGLPTMYLLRYTFGKIGSFIASFLNYLQLIGWTAVMLVVGGKASEIVSLTIYGLRGYEYWVTILGVLVTLWAVAGPKLWRGLERASMFLLFGLSLWLLYIVISNGGQAFLTRGVGGLGFWVALDLVIAMPVSWAPLAADYSRFADSKKSAFWGTFIGYFISSSLFYFIGAFTNIAYGMMDPIELIAVLGLGIPAFLIIIFSTVTTTFMDVYSGGISLKNIVSSISGKKIIFITGILGIVLALFFSIERYEGFLLLIGGFFVPLSVLLALDFYYEKEAYGKGKRVFPSFYNILIWSVGTVFYLLVSASYIIGIDTGFFTKISLALGSSIPTIILVVILYLMFRSLVIYSS